MSVGKGIARGLLVTLRHLFEARTQTGRHNGPDGVHQSPAERGIFTVQYPEEKLAVPENFRYFPMLLVDDDTGHERCTSCGICAKVCPPQCIWIVRGSDANGKPIPEPQEFSIDMSICMSCGYCAEYCPFDAIKMNHTYELANDERRQSLLYHKKDLVVPTSYYAKLHPTDFAEEEKERLAKEEADRKKAEARAAAAAAKPAAATTGAEPGPNTSTTS